MIDNQECIQLINTAIIKRKEKALDTTYEERLSKVCQSKALKALSVAITELAREENISYDQAAIQIVETVNEPSNADNPANKAADSNAKTRS